MTVNSDVTCYAEATAMPAFAIRRKDGLFLGNDGDWYHLSPKHLFSGHLDIRAFSDAFDDLLSTFSEEVVEVVTLSQVTMVTASPINHV